MHLEKKYIKYNTGFKNMPKLVRLGMGGNGRRCERRPLANLKAGVVNFKNVQRLALGTTATELY